MFPYHANLDVRELSVDKESQEPLLQFGTLELLLLGGHALLLGTNLALTGLPEDDLSCTRRRLLSHISGFRGSDGKGRRKRP